MRHFVYVLCLLACCQISISQSPVVQQFHQLAQEELDIPGVETYEHIAFNNEDWLNLWERNARQDLEIQLGEYGAIQINLEEYDIVSPDYSTTIDGVNQPARSTARTFRGYSSDGGNVRLTFSDQFTHGFIEFAGEEYWIEPAWYYDLKDQKAHEIIVYKASDVHFDNHRTCGVTEVFNKSQQLHKSAQSTSRSRVGQCYTVELAIASDFSMYTKYGSSTVEVGNHNIAVMNAVNVDYTGAFDDDIEFVIVTQFYSTCNTCDPWTSSTDATDVLPDFRQWALAGGFQMAHDLGQFWSDRDYDGPTIGLAYVGGLCNSFRYHLIEDWNTNGEALRVTTSHEIGHNFDGVHAPVAGFILSPIVNLTDDWHPNTISDISNYIEFLANQGTCFSPCVPQGNPPVPAFDLVSSNICPMTTITFYDRSTNNPTSYLWTFPGGDPVSSTSPNPVVTYANAGSYQVILQVANASGTNTQTFTNAVNVGGGGQSFPLYQDFEMGLQGWDIENPDGSITWELTSPAAAPGGLSGLFINNFSYPSQGQRDAVLSTEFSLAGYQAASLHVEYAHAAIVSGARDSLIIYISEDGGTNYQRLFGAADNGSGNFATSPGSSTAFEPSSLDDWCGQGPFGADCIDIDISSFLGKRDLIVRVENFTTSGNNIFLDRIYVTSNCFFLPPPLAAFEALPQEGCVPLVVQFNDLSQNSPFEWEWVFDNGSPSSSTLQNPEVIYSQPGTYGVTLAVTNESGSDVLVQNGFITVIGDPVAQFSFSVMGDTVAFTNMSMDATDFLWNFGDGETSAEENPVHIYADDGTYTVSLQVFNDCGDDMVTETIQIGTFPNASYTASPTNGCAPQDVQFLSTSSTNTTSVIWFFEGGDPATSTLEDPLVTYDAAGIYDVTLIAINGSGVDTLFDENAISIDAAPIAAFSSTITGRTVDFINESVGGDDFEWDFGDGNSSMMMNPQHTYAADDSYTVTLIASNVCGSDTIMRTVALGNLPSSNFSSSVTSGCAPLTVSFTADNAGVDDVVAWTFNGGDPMTSDEISQTVVYNDAGTYDVQLIVSNTFGSDTTLMIGLIEAQGPPQPDFIIDYDGFLTVDLTYTGSTYDSIYWDFGDMTSSNEENPTHVYDFFPGYEITCYVFNECGADTLLDGIFVNEPPLQVIKPENQAYCVGDELTFIVNFFGPTPTLNWTFEGGSPMNSMEDTVVVTYAQPGIYDVDLLLEFNGTSFLMEQSDIIVIENEVIADFEANNSFLMNTSQNATSFEWYVDQSLVSQAMDYTLPTPGTYEVMLIGSNSCGSDTTIQMVSFSSTSNNQISYDGMRVIPNPSQGEFRLEFDRPIGQYAVFIVDAKGATVQQFDQYLSGTILNVNRSLTPGLYVIRAVTGDQVYIDKMLLVE